MAIAKIDILGNIVSSGLVAVIRAENPNKADRIAEACALGGPLPQAQLTPTGGVSLENVADWITAGSVAVGVGGNLTVGVKTGYFASITPLARQFMEKIKKARGQ